MSNESINWDKLGFDYIKTDKRGHTGKKNPAIEAGQVHPKEQQRLDDEPTTMVQNRYDSRHRLSVSAELEF